MKTSREITVTFSLIESHQERLRDLTERYNILMGSNLSEKEVFSYIMRCGSAYAIEKAMDEYNDSLVVLEQCGFCGGVI